LDKGLEQGVQFTTNLATDYTVPDYLKLARACQDMGFDRIWVNENLRYRNIFVILSTIASHLDIKIGTAVTVPYFRNPVDLADSIVSLSELTTSDIMIGLARGSPNKPLNLVVQEKPVTMLRESAALLRVLLEGKEANLSDFPFLCQFFHLRMSDRIQLSFNPLVPISLLGGGNSPRSAEVAGKYMDGLLVGTFFKPLLKTQRLGSILATASHAADQAKFGKSLLKVAEIDISISDDKKRGREFARRHAAHAVVLLKRMGYQEKDFLRMGVDKSVVEALEQSFLRGATLDDAASLVSDDIIDAIFVAGDIESCKDEILEIKQAAKEYGFDGVAFSKLGPDYEMSLRLISKFLL
jgi:5,10-methylenetetrahydromethanopterin reductase